MKFMKLIPVIISVLFLAKGMCASEITFSYNSRGAEPEGFGYNKAETYDVAILINQPSLQGKSIVGLKVKLPGGPAVEDVSGWLTSDLKLAKINGKYRNDADIMVSKGTISGDMLSVIFDTPHIVDGPLYAGYSFTVKTLDSNTATPVMIIPDEKDGGLFIHSSRSRLKWGDASAQAGGASAMEIMIEGDFAPDAASFISGYSVAASAEKEESIVTFTVANHSLSPINSIEYTCSSKLLPTISGVYEFEPPLEGIWGEERPIDINMGKLANIGEHGLTLTVDKVNGWPNNDVAPTSNIILKVYPFLPVCRPLVEEYTGLWCAYCPRGYVALETMRNRYPGDFIAVAYHNGDIMSCVEETPNTPGSFPTGYLNRNEIPIGNLYDIWPKYYGGSTPAAIEVEAEWTDDSHSAVRGKATTRFIEDISGSDFMLSYILVIDGLKDEKWLQANAFSPKDNIAVEYPDMPGELGRIFTEGEPWVKGLEFNDVAIAIGYPEGAPESIPSEIKADEEYIHSYVFDLNQIPNHKAVLRNPERMRVIAVVIDGKTGKPINCNSSLNLDGTTGSHTDLPNEYERIPVRTVWYAPNGCPVSDPGQYKGMLIQLDYFADGTLRTSKNIYH